MFFTFIKSFLSVIWQIVVSMKWFFIPLAIFILLWLIDLFFVKFLHFRKAKRDVIGHINVEPKRSFLVKFFVDLPKQIWTNYYNKPIGSFNEHGIIVFCGAQGQGKTIAETKYLNDMVKKYPQLKVYTNYGYLREDSPIESWKDLVFKNNGQHGVICAIDEMQNWFSSSMSKNFPPRMMATVTQNRKNRRVIIASSHFFTNLSKPIRIHTTEIRDCRTFFGCFTIVKRSIPIFDGDGNVIKRKFRGIYTFVHSQDLYDSYDTYRVIENLAEAGFQNDNYAVVQSDSTSGYRPKYNRFGGRSRNSFVEHSVNNNIDSAFNSMR